MRIWVPFNWRGWWRFGTAALGDMACHIIGPAFKLFDLGYPTEVTCNASTVYSGIFREAAYPESGPVSSRLRYTFRLKDGRDLQLYWMDGGFIPDRPEELDPDINANEAMADNPAHNDYEGGTLFIGSQGKISCGWGGNHPRLWPASRNKEVNIPQKYPRVRGGMDGHWWQWVDAAIAGYGNMEVDSPFEGYAGPLTETVLMGNLALRSFNLKVGDDYPGRYIAYRWDGENMRITNFEAANQFVRRKYRQGWGDLIL